MEAKKALVFLMLGLSGESIATDAPSCPKPTRIDPVFHVSLFGGRVSIPAQFLVRADSALKDKTVPTPVLEFRRVDGVFGAIHIGRLTDVDASKLGDFECEYPGFSVRGLSLDQSSEQPTVVLITDGDQYISISGLDGNVWKQILYSYLPQA